MKLLLDANLSWRLSKMLAHDFSEVYHADYVDLSLPASDIDIWNWAKEQNAVAALADCQLTVSQAISRADRPASTKKHLPIIVRR